MRPDRRSYPRACRTTPQGMIRGAHSERISVAEDIREGGGQVFGGDATAGTDAVFQYERILACLADLRGLGEALVDRAEIGKAAAGRDDRERRLRAYPGRRSGPYSRGRAQPVFPQGDRCHRRLCVAFVTGMTIGVLATLYSPRHLPFSVAPRAASIVMAETPWRAA